MKRFIATIAATAIIVTTSSFRHMSVVSGQTPATAPAGAKTAAKHPRLFFTAEELPALRQKAKASPSFGQLTSFAESSRFAARPSDGRGLESNMEMLAQAFVALITQEPRHVDKAKKQLLQAASWDASVWRGGICSPCRIAGLPLGHFAQAVGIAYDWLHPFMADDERKTVRDALARNAFATYKEGIDRNTRSEYWLHITNNWCPVIHGGGGDSGDGDTGGDS
ncbi:MAG: hypothetical protein HZA50_10725 [Planctomycetes bacterium]|nr:hypothetical protein [Planctomycetota bacterium]